MTEENLENVLEGVEPNQDTVEDVETAQATPEEDDNQEQRHAQQQEDDKERNFAQLREAKLQAEREREYWRNYAEQAARQSQQAPRDLPPAEEALDEDYYKDMSDDEIAEIKHLRKLSRDQAKTRKELEEQKRLLLEQTTELRLKSKYPDFDDVVNSDAVAVLRNTYPEIAATINDSKDLYNRAVTAYTLIKRLNPDAAMAQEQSRTLAKNSTKPRVANSVSPSNSDSPLNQAHSYANRMSRQQEEELRRKDFEAMQAAIRNR